jgi:hypothetical protein
MEKFNANLPCENCLTLAMCKARAIKVYKRVFPVEQGFARSAAYIEIFYQCSILKTLWTETSRKMEFDHQLISLMLGDTIQ